MAQNFPTIDQLKEQFLTTFEQKIGQTSPLNDRAFMRYNASVMAGIAALVQREVITSRLENFALTASLDTLKNVFGVEYDLPYKEAASAVLNIELPATVAGGATIPALTNFVGQSNGILYYDTSSQTEVAGVISLQITSRTAGSTANQNLNVGEDLDMSINVAGAETVATVVSIETLGTEAEDTEAYRERVLDIIRAPGGGGNSADYRNWAQEEEGVRRAFPFSGLPFDDPGFPGSSPNRTVYIEATTDIDIDGIAPQTLLDDVRETVITDPETNRHRQSLGITNSTLYIESIRRTPIYTEIRSATFATGTEAQVKAAVLTNINEYYFNLRMFVQGLDVEAERNDLITNLTVTVAVQDVLTSNGASAEGIGFGDAPGIFLPTYQLQIGELTKNGGITYA